MTDEKKAAANAKRAETYKRKREREQAEREERRCTIEILKSIRDDENALAADRLKAIELLNSYNL